MSAIQTDFDRIALLDTDGWTHNGHYHEFLSRHLPPRCEEALEIGCGTGSFSRLLAGRTQHVTALDLSPEMIRLARAHSNEFPNITFQVADVMSSHFPDQHFDCVAGIATLHHLPLPDVLVKIKAALKPGGVLLVLDLFAPEGLLDTLSGWLAVPVSVGLRFMHLGRLRPAREVREAWADHEQHDSYLKVSEVRELCKNILPGAAIRKHLLWRYSIVWQKPN